MKKVHLIKVDTGSCIGCGACVRDCPAGYIELREKKAVIRDQGCMKCGHCVAVCPKGAVSMTGFDEPPAEYRKQTVLEPEQLLQAIRSRRSVRQFQEKAVPPEVIRQIIEAGRFTPTAKNAQNVSYVVLQAGRARAERLGVDFFRRLIPAARYFIKDAKRVKIEEDFFFKKAPAVIVVVSKGGFAETDGALAASNMALMAEANGLGVLYSGFFTMAAKYNGRLRRMLGLRGKEKVVSTLVIGYPAVTYHRTAQRERAAVRCL